MLFFQHTSKPNSQTKSNSVRVPIFTIALLSISFRFLILFNLRVDTLKYWRLPLLSLSIWLLPKSNNSKSLKTWKGFDVTAGRWLLFSSSVDSLASPLKASSARVLIWLLWSVRISSEVRFENALPGTWWMLLSCNSRLWKERKEQPNCVRWIDR